MLDRVQEQLGTFTISINDILEWVKLRSLHGLATGNPKALKVNWEWLEFLKLFTIWTFRVCGKGVDQNVDKEWTPSANEFIREANKTPTPKSKTSKANKHVATEN